ncbi:MAG: dihydrofolate reductase family protein [Verrucomicrobiota bacterium]|nr:dihydrofolate reductase family protein [Verrucomicrobiota bacterium]
MRAKCSVFIATSLDGYIAREDGRIDWLDQANASIPPGEDCGYWEFISTVDTMVMGRRTFEQVLSFPEWPYGQTPVVVLSRGLKELPQGVLPSVSLSKESPEVLVARLSAGGSKHLYIDGGLTIQGFLDAGLIDEMTITRIPILIGQGKTLFGPVERDIPLEHITTHVYEFGFVQSMYRIVGKSEEGWETTDHTQ